MKGCDVLRSLHVYDSTPSFEINNCKSLVIDQMYLTDLRGEMRGTIHDDFLSAKK